MGKTSHYRKSNSRIMARLRTRSARSAAATQDIDLELGNVISGTVDTSTTTFTVSNPTASDELCSLTIILTNGGSQTVNWPASFNWEGGTAPALTTAGVDVISAFTIDGGTAFHAFAASLDSS